MSENIFVIMPAYNAGQTVESVFARLPAEARDRIGAYIVVDDGSSDDTLAALDRVADDFPGLVILRHEENRGYGAAEKTLLRHALTAGADITILLHADGQYSPESIPKVLEPFDSGEADVVQGSRFLSGGARKGGMPIYKFISNKCLTAMENLAFGMKMAEYHSGFMVYSRRFLEAVPFEEFSDSFDFDLEMILAAKIKGFRLVEVAIPTIYADEVSHLNPVKYGLDVLSIVWRYLRGHYHALLRTPRG